MIVKSHAVDQGNILFKAEQPGFWITGLRQRSYCSDFDKPETKCFQTLQVLGILIKTGSEADGVLKIQSGKGFLERNVIERKSLP